MQYQLINPFCFSFEKCSLYKSAINNWFIILQGTSSGKENNCLPQTRVKTIMKSSPDVETVSQESLFLITRATVSFALFLIERRKLNLFCNQNVRGFSLIKVKNYNPSSKV